MEPETTPANLDLTCGDFLKSRRTFLSGATFAVGGLLFTASDAEAATRKYDVDTRLLPQDWVRSQGKEIFRYAKFVNKLRLKHISNQQVIKVHARNKGRVWNEIPPSSLWKNIGETLKVMDKVADEMNQDVKEIVSLYRSPAYNSRCPGAKPNSWHKKNYAMDVIMPSSPWKVYQVAKWMRDSKKEFQGGVGSYRGFTHIDTRGYNATW